MDLFIPIALVIIFCIIFSVCGWCCKKHREGTVYGYGGSPVTVDQVHVSASPVVQPPYPIHAAHPVPQQLAHAAPGPGFVQPPYHPPGAGIPASGFYCPPPVGQAPAPYPIVGAAPYPMAGAAPYPGGQYPPVSSYNTTQPTPPPSYTEAVGHQMPQPQPHTNELYAKQSPYNPNF